MNTVSNLKICPFSQLSQQEKLELKRLGPDRPEFIRSESSSSTSRKFSRSWYTKYEWLTGCSQTQKDCFPCLLFGESHREKAWTGKGINDWKHFSEKVKKHTACACHVENCLKLAFLGRNNITEHLSEAYRVSKQRHNLKVEKIDMRGHNEKADSDNLGVFLGSGGSWWCFLDGSTQQFMAKFVI